MQETIVTTNSTTPIITVEELITYLEIGTQTTEEQQRLEDMISAATILAEDYTGSDLTPKTREQFFFLFDNPEELFGAPIDEVTTVEEDGEALTLTTQYNVLGIRNKRINLVGRTRDANNIKVTYTTVGLADNELIKHAIRRIAANFYVTKSDYSDVTVEQIPLDAQELLTPFVN